MKRKDITEFNYSVFVPRLLIRVNWFMFDAATGRAFDTGSLEFLNQFRLYLTVHLTEIELIIFFIFMKISHYEHL